MSVTVLPEPDRVVTPADPRDLPGPFRMRYATEVRFADTDAMGHVNNAVYLTYCESARAAYLEASTGERIRAGVHGGESFILAEARLVYRSPAFFGELVTVEVRASRVGRSSCGIEFRLTTTPLAGDGPPRLVAVGDSVMVYYDYDRSRPAPLPERFVEAAEAFEGRRLRGG